MLLHAVVLCTDGLTARQGWEYALSLFTLLLFALSLFALSLLPALLKRVIPSCHSLLKERLEQNEWITIFTFSNTRAIHSFKERIAHVSC